MSLVGRRSLNQPAAPLLLSYVQHGLRHASVLRPTLVHLPHDACLGLLRLQPCAAAVCLHCTRAGLALPIGQACISV